LEGDTPIAENCRYVYTGAAGDPFYYPSSLRHQLGLFELASGDEACNNFYYVICDRLTGNPVHMHMRYANAESA
jgi:hypothetical protein